MPGDVDAIEGVPATGLATVTVFRGQTRSVILSRCSNSPKSIEIVKKAASSILEGEAGIERVFSEPTADPRGEDALRITIVSKPGAVEKISGEMAVETLVRIDEALRAANEDRFPMLEYATEDELASSDDFPNPEHLFEQAENPSDLPAPVRYAIFCPLGSHRTVRTKRAH